MPKTIDACEFLTQKRILRIIEKGKNEELSSLTEELARMVSDKTGKDYDSAWEIIYEALPNLAPMGDLHRCDWEDPEKVSICVAGYEGIKALAQALASCGLKR